MHFHPGVSKLSHTAVNSAGDLIYLFIFTRLAFGTHEAAHVLHHADDGQLHLLTESDLFPDVLQRHFLFGEIEKRSEVDQR